MFSTDYPDKYKFVRKLYKKFKELPADIEIETSRLTPGRVCRAALLKLEPYEIFGSRQG